jgi:hypothetical protein
MKHRQWRQLLARSDQETLPAGLAADWKRHLAACPECAEEYACAQAIASALARQAEVQAPDDFNRAVWARIEAAAAPKIRRPARLPLLVPLAVAAAAAALVLIFSPSLHTPLIPAVKMRTAALKPAPPRQAELRPVQRPLQPELMASRPAPQPAVHAPQAREVEQAKLSPAPNLRLEESQPVAQIPAQVVPPLAPARAVIQPNETMRAAAASTFGAAASPQPGFTGSRLLNNKIALNRGEQARLELNLAAPGRISAKIYTREGRLVKTLCDEILPAGYQAFEWDGSTAVNERAASGIYLLVVTGDVPEKRYKIAIIK